MKRVTFEIDEALLARAERLAAARGVSVEAMLTELLARETASSPEASDARRARMDLVELARKSHYGMKGPWSREEAYADRLSRYEHLGLRGDRSGDRPGEVEEGDGDHGH